MRMRRAPPEPGSRPRTVRTAAHRALKGARPTTRRSAGLCRSRRGGRPRPRALLALTREVRRDADQALDEHELTTVVHLVLLRAHEIFQPALGILSHRVGERLVEEIVGERLLPCRERLSALLEKRDDPRFVERL